jgi:hypothetical protein
MDSRTAYETSLPFRSYPKTTLFGLLLIFLVGTALARPDGSTRTGHFLGTLTGAPATIQTDKGAQASTLDLDLVLDVSPRGHDTHSVSVHDVDLAAPSVPTGAGGSGPLDGDLTASGTVPIGPDGRVTLPVTVALHYPLIDRVFPPSPEPFRETFGGSITGTLTFDPEESAYTFAGTLRLSVRGAASGKLTALEIPLDGIELYPDSAAAKLTAGGRDGERALASR